MLSFALGLFLAAAGVTVDADKHSVSFTAVSTGCPIDTQLEFLFVGPLSDRDYEALFVTDAQIPEIADAFAKAGIPLGRPMNPRALQFWPVGNTLEMKPSFTNLVRDVRGPKTPSVIYTGGTRDAKGIPEASTNMPGAVFAVYGCGQSLLVLNDILDQSATYERFLPAKVIPKGERRTFTFTWKGETNWEPFTLKLEPGKTAEALRVLKEKSAQRELDVTTDFSPEMTIKEATACANALALVDSVRVKMNGAAKGQLFFRAFLPLEKWRDRKERLAQPPEVHLAADGSLRVTEIQEDWTKDDSTEPHLTPVEHTCANLADAAKLVTKLGARTSTVLIFAPPETKLKTLFDIRRAVPDQITNWYVFTK